MNERLKLENEFDKNTRQKAEDRQKAASEERARKAKARAKMIDGAINVIKNTPIENLVTYDKDRYRTDKKYKDEVDDKIEGIKSVRALIGGFSGTASILSQSDDGGVYIGSDEMERERLLHTALLENEDVLLHGKKWSEDAKTRIQQARKAGMSVYDMFTDLSEEYLHHYGVRGMRWGRRKYRVPDKSFVGKVSTYTERRDHYRKVAEAIKNSPKKHRIHRLVNGARNTFNEYAMSQVAYNSGINSARFGRTYSSKELANHPFYKVGNGVGTTVNGVLFPKTKGVRLND